MLLLPAEKPSYLRTALLIDQLLSSGDQTFSASEIPDDFVNELCFRLLCSAMDPTTDCVKVTTILGTKALIEHCPFSNMNPVYCKLLQSLCMLSPHLFSWYKVLSMNRFSHQSLELKACVDTLVKGSNWSGKLDEMWHSGDISDTGP